jgi:hypothetical protein
MLTVVLDPACLDVFDYTESLFSHTRRHSHPGGIGAAAFERASK